MKEISEYKAEIRQRMEQKRAAKVSRRILLASVSTLSVAAVILLTLGISGTLRDKGNNSGYVLTADSSTPSAEKIGLANADDATPAPTTPTVPTPSVTDDGIYYGTFGGCDVYFVQGPAQAEFYEEVAGYRFVHNSSFTIYALKDGSCYDLGEAYAMGLLTQEDVEELYRVHKKNETDLWNRGFLYDEE